MIALGAATGSESLDILATVGLVLYIAAFAASIGPLPWVMMSEIFPLKVRSLGMSVTSLANWGFNFLVVFSFPILVSSIGLGGVFAVYALVCAAGLIFTYLLVPETSGVSLEEIERHLESGRPFRALDAAPGFLGTGDQSSWLNRRYSDATAERMDAKVRDIVDGVFKRTLTLLETNRDLLEQSAQDLLQRETLDEPDLVAIGSKVKRTESVAA